MKSIEKIPTDTDRIIAEKIKLRRLLLGMTQMDLAKKCGLSFQQIQKYEVAENRISAARLYLISLILETPIDFFFDNEKIAYKTESLKLLVLYKDLPKEKQKLVMNMLKSLQETKKPDVLKIKRKKKI